jgi:hypothetical protein
LSEFERNRFYLIDMQPITKTSPMYRLIAKRRWKTQFSEQMKQSPIRAGQRLLSAVEVWSRDHFKNGQV